MIGRHPKLELRLELELITVQFSCRYGIITCQLFQKSLVNAYTLIRFYTCYKPCTF